MLCFAIRRQPPNDGGAQRRGNMCSPFLPRKIFKVAVINIVVAYAASNLQGRHVREEDVATGFRMLVDMFLATDEHALQANV